MEYLGTIRLNWKYRQILAEPKETKINQKGLTCSNFVSIEFYYQNSGYSHDSMGQVHLFFLLFVSNLYNLLAKWKIGKFGDSRDDLSSYHPTELEFKFTIIV